MAVIFDLREFTVHDGPGVRQTVFFKGCPLRCRWCHNPEGLSAAPQLMTSAQSCTHCGRCRAVCPRPGKACTACGECVSVCPLNLRQICGRRVSCGELEALLRKNAPYYTSLGGGVTFSGGEPLLQAEELTALLGRLSDLHTCVETCGHCAPGQFIPVMNLASLMILDLKLMDPLSHKAYTGVENNLILENARLLRDGERPFLVRVPLIPGVTDTVENLDATAAFLEGSKSLLRVELLPYHKTAGAKYPMLGLRYQPDFDENAPPQAARTPFTRRGIPCTVL